VVNAICTPTPDLALSQAREAEAAYARGETAQPLLGIPITIKDLIVTQGIRTTFGSYIHEQEVPDEDAPVVERVRAAGAIMLGKSATSEFGWKAPTTSPLFGTTRNPWDLERSTAGSSGGAAAAVATGMGPLAIGTDGGGSVRMPASFCGVVGLKPSVGRVPTAPPSLIGNLDHTGPMGRTVRDVALLLDVIAGGDDRDWFSVPRDPESYLTGAEGGVAELRVSWTHDLGYAVCDPEVARIIGDAARTFEQLGCTVEQDHPRWSDPAGMFETLCFELWGGTMMDYLAEWEDRMDPGLVTMIRSAGTKSSVDIARALLERIELQQQAVEFFKRFDLLLTPTMTLPPFGLDVERQPTEVGGRPVAGVQWMAFTYPFNLTGHPAITVPAGWTADGLPVGLQIVGPWRNDRLVLRAAAAFEAAAPWSARWPSVVGRGAA
jgi:aspartyl-tRNA(Asn)/glutamyl-tRNA(Gln) amidotransferase subunit A